MNEPTAQSPRKVLRRATIPGPPGGPSPSLVSLSSRSLRLRKDKRLKPVVRSGCLSVLKFRAGACPSVPTHCYSSNGEVHGPAASLPHPASLDSSLNPRLLTGNARVRATPIITVRNKVDQGKCSVCWATTTDATSNHLRKKEGDSHARWLSGRGQPCSLNTHHHCPLLPNRCQARAHPTSAA